MVDVATHRVAGEHQYDGMTMPMAFPKEHLDKVKELEYREDDILVATCAKAGTTWLQEILFSIFSDGNFDELNKVPLPIRSPFLEVSAEREGGKYDGIALMEKAKPRRILKTHLPYHFFEKSFKTKTQPKTIVVLRNLKDNLVSFYHFYRAIKFFNFAGGIWDQFFTLYKEKRLVHGDWFDMNLSWWNQRNDPKILVIFYEDMKKDIHAEIRKISDFIGHPVSDETLEKIVEHTSFDQMKQNKMVNHEDVASKHFDPKASKFMRKGQVGDWVNYFTPEQTEFVDKQLKEKLAGTGLSFRET